MSVLVTGGCGFLGLHVLKRLSDEGYDVIAYDVATVQPDVLRRFYKADLNKIRFVRGDLLDVPRVLETVRKLDVKHMVHLATMLTKDSEDNPPKAFKVNVEGTLNLLEISRVMDVEKLVYASSEAVYGVTGEAPVHEDHPKRPNSVYGITKLTSEFMGLKYSELYGLDFIALRFPMIYGPGIYGGGTRLINYIIESAVKGEAATIPFTESMRVEPLHVADAANSVYLALKARRPAGKVYNIGIGRICTLREVLETIKSLYPNTSVSFGDMPGHLIYPVQGPLVIERARTELNFTPRYDLISGVKNYVEVTSRGSVE
ncbi:MAG: NAD(P)-dependent oxidoreductase [Zestosphaera sp.]